MPRKKAKKIPKSQELPKLPGQKKERAPRKAKAAKVVVPLRDHQFQANPPPENERAHPLTRNFRDMIDRTLQEYVNESTNQSSAPGELKRSSKLNFGKNQHLLGIPGKIDMSGSVQWLAGHQYGDMMDWKHYEEVMHSYL